MHSEPEGVYVLGDPPNYEPEEEASVAAYARRHGLTGAEAFYDLLTEGTGETLLLYYLNGYSEGNLDYMHSLMSHPRTRNGLSDAGAHVGAVSDAHLPSWNLAYWGRDRRRGATLDLETARGRELFRQLCATADMLIEAEDPGRMARLGLDYPDLARTRPELIVAPASGGFRETPGARNIRYSGVLAAKSHVSSRFLHAEHCLLARFFRFSMA